MPVKSCQDNGKPGFKCGDRGKCYTYTPGNEAGRKSAKKKAIAQCIAIGEPPGGEALEDAEVSALSQEILRNLLKSDCEEC